jgi:hypothetical protein
MTYITLEQLKALRACSRSLEEFERVFGKRAKITKENIELCSKTVYLKTNWLIKILVGWEKYYHWKDHTVKLGCTCGYCIEALDDNQRADYVQKVYDKLIEIPDTQQNFISTVR